MGNEDLDEGLSQQSYINEDLCKQFWKTNIWEWS